MAYRDSVTQVCTSWIGAVCCCSNNPDAGAQRHGGQLDLDLVDEPSLDSLRDDICAARDTGDLAACGVLGLRDRALDAVGDEGKDRS